MLEEHRLTQLNKAVDALYDVEGMHTVQSDDWDSTHINIILVPKVGVWTYDDKPLAFSGGVRRFKHLVKKVLNDLQVPFNWLDYPIMKYTSSTVMGKKETWQAGYDQEHFKIEVCIPK